MKKLKIDQTQKLYDYFDADHDDAADYVAPNMVIDGLEEKQDDEFTQADNSGTSSVVYHSFGEEALLAKRREEAEKEVNKEEDDIWVDDSEFEADKIYLNPAVEKETVKEDSNELDLFGEDIFEDNYLTEHTREEKQIKEEKAQPANGETLDFYKATSEYDNMTVNYLDNSSKEKLGTLSEQTVAAAQKTEENKDVISVAKEFEELEEEFAKDGLVVKPYRKTVHESVNAKTYLNSNKLSMVKSWTGFGIITFLLTLTFLIMNNYSASYTYDFSGNYFLIGIAVLAIIPIAYTIVFAVNPYKKKPARFASRIYTLFAILLTIQIYIIIYCLNLQLGFYSFAQENYNHLIWIIPCIMGLYPLVDAVLHIIYYNSKNFHV